MSFVGAAEEEEYEEEEEQEVEVEEQPTPQKQSEGAKTTYQYDKVLLQQEWDLTMNVTIYYVDIML